MIVNIIDRREKPYRWLQVNAIVEATWHDNAVPDSDQAEVRHEDSDYEEREGVSVAEAVQWASALGSRVTLHLYRSGASQGRAGLSWRLTRRHWQSPADLSRARLGMTRPVHRDDPRGQTPTGGRRASALCAYH